MGKYIVNIVFTISLMHFNIVVFDVVYYFNKLY